MSGVPDVNNKNVVPTSLYDYLTQYGLRSGSSIYNVDEERVHGLDCKHGVKMLARYNSREAIHQVHVVKTPTHLSGLCLDGLYAYDKNGELLSCFPDFSLLARDAYDTKYQRVATAAGISVRQWMKMRIDAQSIGWEHVFVVEGK